MAPRGWWHIVAKLLQCLQFPAWEQPLSPAWGRLRFPAWEHLPVPCLGTFAVPAWDACQFPAWERLPVCMPCLGMLAVPAWDACQFPAWERLPVPCLGTFASAIAVVESRSKCAKVKAVDVMHAYLMPTWSKCECC